MVWEHDDPQPEADALGTLAQRSVHDVRAGRPGEPRQEVVLNEPHIVEAHPVGQDDLLESLFDQQMVVQIGPGHLIVQTHLHTQSSIPRPVVLSVESDGSPEPAGRPSPTTKSVRSLPDGIVHGNTLHIEGERV